MARSEAPVSNLYWASLFGNCWTGTETMAVHGLEGGVTHGRPVEGALEVQDLGERGNEFPAARDKLANVGNHAKEGTDFANVLKGGILVMASTLAGSGSIPPAEMI